VMQQVPLAYRRPVGLGVSCSPLQAKALPSRPLLQRVRRCAVVAAGSGALTPSAIHNDGRQQQRGELQVRLVTEVHFGTSRSLACMDTISLSSFAHQSAHFAFVVVTHARRLNPVSCTCWALLCCPTACCSCTNPPPCFHARHLYTC
jgi:hypothetical protein